MGRKLLLTPQATPGGPHENQTVGTVTASHKMLALQALSSSLSMPALQREAAWAEERLLGDLRQSVPQNGRVHLRILEIHSQTLQIGIGIGKFSIINSEELHIGNFWGDGSLKGDRNRYPQN